MSIIIQKLLLQVIFVLLLVFTSLRKQSLVQISAVRTGVFAYMNGTLSPVMQIEEHVF